MVEQKKIPDKKLHLYAYLSSAQGYLLSAQGCLLSAQGCLFSAQGCFLIAINFLTRIPVTLKGEIKPGDVGQSLLCYPLVGLLIGTILYLIFMMMQFVSASMSVDVIAAVILIVWVLITGGLHLDGLADSADAWAGGQGNQQKTLDIMQDPYCGPIGVTVIMLVLLLKWTALSAILNSGSELSIIVIPMLSRALIIIMFMSTHYVRDNGLGSVMANNLPKQQSLWIVLILAGLVYLLFANLLSIILVVLTVVGLRWLMLKRISGMTGDTMGAVIEVSEGIALMGQLL
jgi:adenosylcobinamide-GDP ribazoletransferase